MKKEQRTNQGAHHSAILRDYFIVNMTKESHFFKTLFEFYKKIPNYRTRNQ